MPPKKQTVVKKEGKKQSPADSSINKIGNYTIVQDIGHGSFADVYKVKNNQGKEFAMKKIRRYCSVRRVVSFHEIKKSSFVMNGEIQRIENPVIA